MGAWGYAGYDNDTAADWLDSVVDQTRFTLLRAFWSRYQEEGIAAAQLLTELARKLQERLGVQVFVEALEIVDDELKPEKYKQYNVPGARLAYLRKLKRALETYRAKFPKVRRGQGRVKYVVRVAKKV